MSISDFRGGIAERIRNSGFKSAIVVISTHQHVKRDNGDGGENQRVFDHALSFFVGKFLADFVGEVSNEFNHGNQLLKMFSVKNYFTVHRIVADITGILHCIFRFVKLDFDVDDVANHDVADNFQHERPYQRVLPHWFVEHLHEVVAVDEQHCGGGGERQQHQHNR